MKGTSKGRKRESARGDKKQRDCALYSARQKSWPVAHKFDEDNYKTNKKVYILVKIHTGY